MTPHPFQACMLAALHDAAAETSASADAALWRSLVDEIDCGVMVCQADSTICFANQAMRHGDPPCDAGHDAAAALRCDARDAACLHAAVLQAATKGRRQLILLAHGPRRRMVSVAPLRLGGVAEPRVLLMLGRRMSCSALAVEMLGAAYALTLAERRVLAGLLADAAPREIAETLGVQLSTVRSQITSIRLKAGVRSIEALLLLAAEVPPLAAVVRSSGDAWQPSRIGAAPAPGAAWGADGRTRARMEAEVTHRRVDVGARTLC